MYFLDPGRQWVQLATWAEPAIFVSETLRKALNWDALLWSENNGKTWGKQQGLSDFFLLKLQCVLYTPLSDTPSSSKQGMSRHLQGTSTRKQSWIAGILWIRCTGRINMHANRAAALNSSIKKWTFKGIEISKSGFTWIYCTLTFITFQLFFTSFTRFYKGIFFLCRRLPGSMTTPAWPKL